MARVSLDAIASAADAAADEGREEGGGAAGPQPLPAHFGVEEEAADAAGGGLPPRPHADDPMRAARTGLLLKALLDGDGDESNGVTASIGIASGRAFCGVVGSTVGERREFTVMGDVVNVSARLMGLASKARAPSRLLIDECTQSYTEIFIMSRRCPPQRLKGKA